MNQMNTPEVTLAKALEFLKTNDEDNTIIIINDFIQNSKRKYWTSNHEQLISILIDLSIKKNRLKLLKDGLNYYRTISQNTNIDSLANILTKAKDAVEDKFLKAQKSYQGYKIDIQDLDAENSPEMLFLNSFEDVVDSKEKEDLINTQKFIWDTYKILLDLTKTNSKLLSLYAQILKSAFIFCKENKRKVEFKRLCDSVRGYLQTLIKTEKKQFFQNKVQISRPEVLKILIQIRISLLDTATELEQWQEAFKTAEDIIFLMDKYEKQIGDDKTKKSTKIPPLMKLEFYLNIEKLLWISDYHLYHAYSTVLIKELAGKAVKWIKTAKNVEKQKEGKLKIEKFDLENINNGIILSALVTPFKNSYTNYFNIGNELFENEKDIETQTCARMMNILKLNVVPGRKNLLNIIQINKILDEPTCDEKIKFLYNMLTNETNPLILGKTGKEIITYLKSDPKFEKYSDLIAKNIIIKGLILMSKNYDSISFSRLIKIFPWVERENIEEIISENTRIGVLRCIIDHSKDLIKFKNAQCVMNTFNETLNGFVNSISSITCEIILTNTGNALKLSNLKETVYKEIHSYNTNSLGTYDTLIAKMEQTNTKLDIYLKEKGKFKEALKETQAKQKSEKKEKAEEETKMMKELMKDEQKKKEFDTQLKKYLIDRIKIYTSILYIDGKKVKLDDILKDLTKISDEQLIKLLEKEEYEFKTKKEKRFKQIHKDTDYMIREFRRRDFDVSMKNLAEEERVYNELLEEEEKKSYNEKIGFKSNLMRFKSFKENYFNEIQDTRDQEYTEKMSEFTQSLYKKVHEDLLKEIGTIFKAYVEDFRKREEESSARQTSWSKPLSSTNSFMKKGDRYTKTEDKPRGIALTSVLTDFKKGLNFVATTNEPKLMSKEPSEFKKGDKFIAADTTAPVKTEFLKGINIGGPILEKKEFKRAEKSEIEAPTQFRKAEKSETETPSIFKRAEKTELISTTSTSEIIKGAKLESRPIFTKRTESSVVSTPSTNSASTTTTKVDTGFKRATAPATITTPTNIIKKAEVTSNTFKKTETPSIIKKAETPSIIKKAETPSTTGSTIKKADTSISNSTTKKTETPSTKKDADSNWRK